MGKPKIENIPADVYIQFVRSLFDNAQMLVIGGACYWILCLMIYLRTNNPLFLALSFILLSVSLFRYFGIRTFHRLGGTIASVEEARQWERSYILKGSLQGLGLGTLCFLSIYVYPDPFAELAAMSLTLATLVTVGGVSRGEVRGLVHSDIYRVISFFPYTVPAIVIGIVWAQIYDPSSGLLNGILTAIGFSAFKSFAWLGEERTAMGASIFVIVWSMVGFYMVLFVAAIKGIPGEVYEAARVDGAGRFRTAISITVPMIRDTIRTAYI